MARRACYTWCDSGFVLLQMRVFFTCLPIMARSFPGCDFLVVNGAYEALWKVEWTVLKCFLGGFVIVDLVPCLSPYIYRQDFPLE